MKILKKRELIIEVKILSKIFMINTTNCLKIGIMLIYKKITNKNQMKKEITRTEEMKLKILKSH